MLVTAKLKYAHITPRKMREAADLIRGKRAGEAQSILEFAVKKPTLSLLKLLKSAVASAVHNFQLEPANLYIAKILVDEGPKQKRWRPASMGHVAPIMKRTSHVTIVLGEIEEKGGRKREKPVLASEPGKEAVRPLEESFLDPKAEEEAKKPKGFKPTKEKKLKMGTTFKRIFSRKSI